MSAVAGRPVTPCTFWLVLLLVVAGLGLRLFRGDSLPAGYNDYHAEIRLVRFLEAVGLPDPRRVHYTRDGGIRGLQIALPECGGYLQIAVMPEGDEFLALWHARSGASGYRAAYLFDRHLYNRFPSAIFWFKTMRHALAHRLQLTGYRSPGAVLAMAYPGACPVVQAVPWRRFNPVGRQRSP